MANTVFKLRRSSVPGKVPNTDILSIGELALNLTDRKLYSSDGITVFETGSNLTSLSVFSDIKVGNSTVNTVITSTGLVVNSIPVVLSYSINVQTTGTGSQVIDSFLKSEIRGAEYVFTLTDNSSNGYQITKALVLQDSGNSYITEYGVLYSNTVLGVFSTSVNSTHSIVSVTPSVGDMQVKGTKSLIVV